MVEEWCIILALVLLIILIIFLVITLIWTFSGHRCTISIQQRELNHKLTKTQQEEELKQQKKFSSRWKRTLNLSTKSKHPIEPIEDVKTIALTLKLNDIQENSKPITTNTEPSIILLPKIHNDQAERRAKREKIRKAIRKKYDL